MSRDRPRTWTFGTLFFASAGFARARSRAPRVNCSRRRGSLAGPAVRDRRAAVAAEGLRAELDAGRRLAPLVLSAVDHRERPVDDVRIEAVLRELLARAVELDVRLEDAVELRVRRKRIFVALVGTQLRARRALDDRGGDELAPSAFVEPPREPEDVRLVD